MNERLTLAVAKDLSKIGIFLEEHARQATPIFYNDLAKDFGLPPVGEFWSSHPFCDLFGSLDAQDYAQGRPFRTSLVVSRDKGIPGEGLRQGVEPPARDPLPN